MHTEPLQTAAHALLHADSARDVMRCLRSKSGAACDAQHKTQIFCTMQTKHAQLQHSSRARHYICNAYGAVLLIPLVSLVTLQLLFDFVLLGLFLLQVNALVDLHQALSELAF